MEAAKDAIARHTSRRGHFTNVEEHIRPAVTSETIKPHRHEITTEAYNREVHQHHYHTTVQPLSHREVIPEKHTHNLLPMRKTEHHHEDKEENDRKLSAHFAQFKNMSTTHETTHSNEAKPAVIGEHVHHHVHEVVQPIIYKETHQRETVHTTMPIHEIHHQKAIHHGLSSLPMKTMEEFHKFNSGRKAGEIRHSQHDGAPREYDSKLATTFEKLGLHSHHEPGTQVKEQSPSLPPVDTNSRGLGAAAPITPTRRAHRHPSSGSTSSSASDSVPSTPTSPKYRNEMLPKNNIMNTMALNNEGTVNSPTHETNTYTPTHHINTRTSTSTKVDRVPSKTAGGDRPVKIVGNGNEGDLSPRYSSDDAAPARRSFMGRLTGSTRRAY